ncbi:tyrosine-protein kinase-like otk [Etheostoma spectabile]|uniref:tyrosine-protein kinase-like otk n=1 Tax=Etheostoma spectabile TaxID=54343 RepID=UPI0013AE900D|nr:tyrosine-protein kinase-like otk [Etheostoma spectabile]
MAEFRRIQITLFVILLLQVTAVPRQTHLSVTVRAGDDVPLPCENVITQGNCDQTTWLSSRNGEAAVELIAFGQIKDNIPKTKSDRLSVTEKCSLVIKNVTGDDAGRYTCRQFNTSGPKLGPDAVVHLSVVTMEELKNTDDSSTLSCSVLTYDECKHTVEWLYEGDETDVEIRPATCSAQVSFTPRLNQNLLKCNVTDKRNGNTLLCNVGPRSSCKKSGSSTVGTDYTPENDTGLWVYIFVPVGVTALLAALIIVLVIRRKKTKRNKTQTVEKIELSSNSAATQSAPETSQDMADPEGGVFYASINHTKKTNSKAQAQGKDADADANAVTYSTVRASSSSAAAAASADLSDLYATVNKPNQ